MSKGLLNQAGQDEDLYKFGDNIEYLAIIDWPFRQINKRGENEVGGSVEGDMG